MTVYIGLLAIMMMAFCVDHSKVIKLDREERSERILRFLMVLLYLICALRAYSVGRDMPGYRDAYEMTKDVKWNNYNYIYFEKGYVFLMKLCIAGRLSFQGFMAVSYALILFPIYLFIRRYSKEKVLSVFVFVCYMFFEFSLTGLRQAISMSIALFGFMLLSSDRPKKSIKLIGYIAIIGLAALFHKGALVCYVALPFLLVDNLVTYLLLMIVGSSVSLVARRYIFFYIRDFFEKDSFSVNVGLHIGLNLILLLSLSLIFLLAYNNEQNAIFEDDQQRKEKEKYRKTHELFIKIYMLSILVAFFFGEETSARSYMYFNQIMIVLLPNDFQKLSRDKMLSIGFILIAFLIIFFAWNTLAQNSFDIVPYQFFWQIP